MISAARVCHLTFSLVSTRGPALIAVRCNLQRARTCCRPPAMARSGLFEWITTNPRLTACRGAIHAIRRSLFRPWLCFPALFSKIRPAIKTCFSRTATLSHPATPMNFDSPTPGRIRGASFPRPARFRWHRLCRESISPAQSRRLAWSLKTRSFTTATTSSSKRRKPNSAATTLSAMGWSSYDSP